MQLQAGEAFVAAPLTRKGWHSRACALRLKDQYLMEAPRCLPEGTSRWTGESLMELRSKDSNGFEALAELIDTFGAESGVAQKLKGPLTTVKLLRDKADRRLYVHRHGPSAVGMLCCGEKHLYYWRKGGGTVELDPPCVLDFYVSSSMQRMGCGKTLFDNAVAAEGANASAFAYDRPSPKMLPFLKKLSAVGVLKRLIKS